MRGPDFTRPHSGYDQAAAAAGGGAGTYSPTPSAYDQSGRGKRGHTKALVAAVLAAGLIGGCVGAGGMYLIDQGSTETQQQAAGDTSPGLQQNRGGSEPNASSTPKGTAQAVAEKVLPSVVSISMVGPEGAGNGSGVVLSKDGMILTNNHVAEAGQQGELTVTFNNGETAPASIVGLDPATDLAVIQAEGVSDLTPIELGTSGDLSIGQDVLAVGSPLTLKLSGTVTSGIVSALDRPVRTGDNTQATVIDAIQTDAAINPGNSGGALVDMNGNLIGINTAIATAPGSGGSGNIGLGFSIPIDQAKPIAEQLMDEGRAEHAQIGVQLHPATGMQSSSSQPAEGAVVANVNQGSPGSEAGLQAGDVVTKVNDRRIADSDSLIAAIRSYRPGDKVELTYARNGNEDTVSVTLGSDLEN